MTALIVAALVAVIVRDHEQTKSREREQQLLDDLDDAVLDLRQRDELLATYRRAVRSGTVS